MNTRRLAAFAVPGILVAALMSAVPAHAQEGDAGSADTQSGFKDLPKFGGEGSTPAQLEEDDAVTETVFRFDGVQRGLAPYFDFKRRLNEDHGLAFGLDYTGLYYGASESLGADDAASGNFRLFGSWTVLGRGTADTGSIVFKVEDRHSLGGSVPVI